MLQFGQHSTLNHTKHRFFAHSTYNYGHIASFTHFHLTTISQCAHHASVLNDGQTILLDQLWGKKNCGLHNYPPKLQHQKDRSTSPLNNRVLSFGLPLIGAIQELPKKCNFCHMQVQFWFLQQQQYATTQCLIINSIGDLATNTYAKFWVAILDFLR